MWWAEAKMTLVRIDAEFSALAGLASLRTAMADLPEQARITVMVHGFKFSPGIDGRCPHGDIFSLTPGESGSVSWPRHLGLGAAHLGIAFGWDGAGSLWRAWREARAAGAVLARLADLAAAEGRSIDLIAHSLGARVALSAMAQAEAGALGKAILIAPAEFQARAQEAMDRPCGAAARVLNVVSRENALYDRGLEWLLAPHRLGERSLGLGLSEPRGNWTDLRIDDPAALDALARLGYPIAPPLRRVCHWSGYLRPGIFALYRAVLSGSLALSLLRAALPEPRRGAGGPGWLLPFAAKASS
jgi:hypothetical protein